MRRKLAPALVAGAVLWGLLTVACSAAVDGPAPGGATWGGTIEGRGDPAPAGPPLAVSWDKRTGTDTLYRVYPRTMRLRDPYPLRTRGTMGADLSPDGSLLLANFRGRVQVVDLPRMRDVSRSAISVRGMRDVFWVADDVAILVADGRGKTKLVRFQPSTGTALGVESFPGTYFAVADAGDGVVLLTHGYDVEPPAAPEPATLAVMDAAGEFATVRLDHVGAGFFEASDGAGEQRAVPALAVRDSRATVVGTDGTIVSVDLATLDATVESEDASLLERLAAWFVPPVHAKTFAGTELSAEWAGPDALLVSGYRADERDTEPVGALLLDPDDWSVTTVDDEAYDARMAGDHLLAWKTLMVGDDRREGIGLRAYDPGGELDWQVFDGQFVRPLAVHRDVVFVEHGWHRVLVSSVDLTTGEVLATRYSHVNVLSL